MITFHHHERDGDVALVVAGEIDIATSDAFYDQLRLLVASAHSPAFVDLSQVTFIDSSGLNALVRASRTAEAAGVNLVLHEPSERVRRVMFLSGLADAFEVQE